MKLSIVIPTITGRERFLASCIRSYVERTPPDVELDFIVPRNHPSCGSAWRWGSENAVGDLLHFTADDIVAGEGWFPPCLEAVEHGGVPVVGVIIPRPADLGPDQYPLPGNPHEESSVHFFEDWHPVADWQPAADTDSEYPSIPFCSMEQWVRRIEPMIVSHYGTDKWFGKRAKAGGCQPVVRTGSLFYHFAAQEGRIPMAAPGWMHLDRLNFDLNIAFDAYVNGSLDPGDQHPLYGTPEGRAQARAWYASHVAAERYWEAPGVEEQYR